MLSFSVMFALIAQYVANWCEKENAANTANRFLATVSLQGHY